MAYRPSERRNQKKQTPPEQPNLVPIMNLFITIIPFLLTMIVISQVALVALNFSAPGGGGSDTGSEPGGGPEKDIQIIVMASSGNQVFPGFEIRGWDKSVFIRNSDNQANYNFIALNQTLREIKTQHQKLTDITLIVYPDVLYGTLIQTIDLCKQNGFPNVIYKPAVVSYGVGR